MTRALAMPVAALLIAAIGCGEGYVMRGKVVEGPISSISVVGANDPRLAGPPIEGATLRFMLDPRSVDRTALGSIVSYEDGTFGLPMDQFGAGLLLYEVEAVARADKFKQVKATFALPSADKRVLITLAPGQGTVRGNLDEREQIEDELRRYGTR